MSATSTIPITIGGQVIQMPNTGASPIWSQAIIQLFQAISVQLEISSSPFDIAPTVQVLTNNVNTNLNLLANNSNLTFPNTSVRSFTFTYAVYRVTDTPTSNIQGGVVTGIYNTSTAAWSLQHSFEGDAPNGVPYCTFDINPSDELLLNTTSLSPGIYDAINSAISFSAKTELVSS